jgi:hypothetical protein
MRNTGKDELVKIVGWIIGIVVAMIQPENHCYSSSSHFGYRSITSESNIPNPT